jgi:prophage regulatory protein
VNINRTESWAPPKPKPNTGRDFGLLTKTERGDKHIAIDRLVAALRLIISNPSLEEEIVSLNSDCAIRVKETMELTGDKRSNFYARLNAKSPTHDPTFPRPFYLGRSPRWWRQEVIAWLREKAAIAMTGRGKGESHADA